MRLSILVLAFNLLLSANAFNLYDEHHDPNNACDRALSADIDCDDSIVDYLEFGYVFRGSELRERECTKSCSRSIQSWYTTLSNECGSARVKRYGKLWKGWNLTCEVDTETGRYCSEMIEEFENPRPAIGEDLAPEYLCHPCYVHLLTTLNTWFGINERNLYYFENLVLAKKTCGKPITVQTSSLRTMGEVLKKARGDSSSSAPVVKVEALIMSIALFAVAFCARTRIF
ncbi:hypothetical protein FLONG3_6307 [Fusarium longipes]|uniref:Uncharacterized protein n=1 Tax=Fusarium longipes TaxID=694270 RepID=A0A395SM91_9HYPO|nr:hypothetical protein FLONG3_6307 [Fusarium longipes]